MIISSQSDYTHPYYLRLRVKMIKKEKKKKK